MPTFTETQSRLPVFAYAVVALVAVVMWVGWFVQIVLGRPFGANPAPDAMLWVFMIIFGVGLPVVIARVQLKTEVNDTAIIIRLRPLLQREIPFSEIEHVDVVTYQQPIQDFGGWGVRRARGNRRAYNMRGNRGVELKLSSRQHVLIGSQRPNDLAAAIEGQLDTSL